MKTRETSLWKWFSNVRRSGSYDKGRLHMERVENAVAVGTPDVDICFNGACIKLELKTAEASANGDVRVKITPSQVDWARRRIRAGGRSYVLVQVGGMRFLLHGANADKLLSPISVDKLKEMAMVDWEARPEEMLWTMHDDRTTG